MFKFAVSAVTVPREEIGRQLAVGISHAFPVGFVGLILSVIAHFIASSVEDRFRKSVNDATQHAMQIRQATGQSAFDRLEAVLAPLQNLQQVLAGSLQPVIAGFQQQLADTSALIQGQIQPLASAVAAMRTAIEALAQPTANLAAAAAGLPQTLAETACLQRDNRELLDRTAAIVKESSDTFHAAATSMQQASAGLHEIPGSLRSTFETELVRMGNESQRLWNEAARDHFAALSPACESLATSANSLRDTSAALNSVPASLSAQLQSALADLSTLHAHQLSEFSERSFDAWAEVCRRFVDRMNEATTAFCDRVLAATAQTAMALDNAGREVQNLANQASHHLDSSVAELYRRSLVELRPHLQRMDEAVSSRYPAALESLTAACDGLKQLERLSNQIAPEMEAIHAALRRSAEELRQASVRRDAAPPSPELAAIRTGVERLADRLAPPPGPGILDRLFRRRSDGGDHR
jgi:hypothetical protein